jgi:hypothetical protein
LIVVREIDSRRIRVRLTTEEREGREIEKRLARVKARERRLFNYSLKAYKRLFPSMEPLDERTLGRLRVVLDALQKLYGGWRTLAKVMKTNERVLLAAYDGKRWAATYALAVFAAEIAGMDEERLFHRESFKLGLSHAYSNEVIGEA